MGTLPAPRPLTRVASIVFLGDAGCIAYDHGGHQRWRFDCGNGTHKFGSGASPLLYNDLVIVNASPESGDLIAIDKRAAKRFGGSQVFGSIMEYARHLSKPAGSNELALSIEGKVLGFNPEDGSPLWSCQAIDDYICPSVVVHEGIVFALGGRANKAVAVRSGGSGDVTETHRLWVLEKGSNVSSPVIHEKHIYGPRKRGLCIAPISIGQACLRTATQAHFGTGLRFTPSCWWQPVLRQQRKRNLCCGGQARNSNWLPHNIIEGDESVFNASPIPSGDGLLLRSDKYLYHLRARAIR